MNNYWFFDVNILEVLDMEIWDWDGIGYWNDYKFYDYKIGEGWIWLWECWVDCDGNVGK